MIGDWVFNSHHNKSIQITQYDFFTHSHKDGVQSFEGVLNPKPTLGRDLSPIPLTESILKANGFNIRRDAYYLSCGFLGNDWERSGVEVKFYDRAVIDIECNYFKYTNRIHLVADYVHELQHALRLCGLNELADNFKIQ